MLERHGSRSVRPRVTSHPQSGSRETDAGTQLTLSCLSSPGPSNGTVVPTMKWFFPAQLNQSESLTQTSQRFASYMCPEPVNSTRLTVTGGVGSSFATWCWLYSASGKGLKDNDMLFASLGPTIVLGFLLFSAPLSLGM